MWEAVGEIVKAVCELTRSWAVLVRVCILTTWLGATFLGAYWAVARMG